MLIFLSFGESLDYAVTVIETYRTVVQRSANFVISQIEQLILSLSTQRRKTSRARDKQQGLAIVSKTPLLIPARGTETLDYSIADRAPSLFQDYRILHGVPVREIDFRATESLEGVKDDSVMLCCNGEVCLCHVFSWDDVFVAFGMGNGSVRIYETDSCQLLWMLHRKRQSPVADLVFLKDEKVLVCVDAERRCSVWNLKDEPECLHETDYTIQSADGMTCSMEMPCLSQDGQFLAVPVLDCNPQCSSSKSWQIPAGSQSNILPLLDVQQYMHLHIYATTKPASKLNSKNPANVSTLSARMEIDDLRPEGTKKRIQFSPGAPRVLITARDWESSYLDLWPDLRKADARVRLHGSHGVFSPDDDFLVTWTGGVTGDSDQCFVWEMRKLESLNLSVPHPSWKHPEHKAMGSVVLQDPRFCNVLKCGFVSVRSEQALAVCYGTETVVVVIWSVVPQVPLSILQTDFDASLDAFHFCVSLHRDSICLSSHSKQEARVLSAEHGVELLCMKEASEASQPKEGWSGVCFSHTSRFLLATGRHQVSLLNATPLQPVLEQPFMKYTKSTTESEEKEPIVKFSPDGQCVGFLLAPGCFLDIWSLPMRHRFTLDWKGIVQARNDQIVQSPAVSAEQKFIFYQFCFSKDSQLIATCMADNAVLLWSLERKLKCQMVAQLPSDCLQPHDICFSWDPRRNMRLVVCQAQGNLIWIDPLQAEVIKNIPAEGSRVCRFSTDGTRAVLMSDLFTVHVWDLVHCVRLYERTHLFPLLSLSTQCIQRNLFKDGRFLAGFDEERKPVIYDHQIANETVVNRVQVPSMGVSDDGRWGMMVEPTPVDCAEASHSAESREVSRRKRESCPLSTCKKGERTDGFHSSTLYLIPLTEEGVPKELQLPDSFLSDMPVSISMDGRRCAAINDAKSLILLNAHMTKGDLLQAYFHILAAIQNKDSPPSDLQKILQSYGAPLLNQTGQNGMTLFTSCVYYRKIHVLKALLNWAIENGCKVKCRGPVRLAESQSVLHNILDLALFVHCPESTKILLEYLVEGVTTEAQTCQIFEESLADVASVYPCLFAEVVQNSKFVRCLGSVSIPSQWLSSTLRMATATYSNLLSSPQEAVQLWKSSEAQKFNHRPGPTCVPISAIACVVPISNLAKISPDGLLHRLNASQVHHSVFGSEMIKAIVDFKYKAYGKRLVQEDFFQHVSLMVCFTLMSISLLCSGTENMSYLTIFFTMSSASLAFGYVLYHVRLMHLFWTRHGIRGIGLSMKLFLTCMLVLCFVAYLMIAFVVPICLIWYPQSPFLGPAIGIASMVLWMRLCQFLETYDRVGPVIVTLQEVVFDINWFLILLLIAVIGSGISLFLMVSIAPSTIPVNPDEMELNARNPGTGILISLMLMLSDVGSVFSHLLKTVQGVQLFAVLGLVIFYLDLIAIIALNVMIAMMGDSYDRVKNSEKSLFTKRKAQLLHSLEVGLSQKRHQEINAQIGKYLHFVKPKDSAFTPMRLWEGRLNEIQHSNREGNRELERCFTTQLKDLEERLMRIEQRVSYT